MSQALSMQRDWYSKAAGCRHTQTHTHTGRWSSTDHDNNGLFFFFFAPGLVPSDILRVYNMLGKMWHGHVC